MNDSITGLTSKVMLWAQKGLDLGWLSQQQVDIFNDTVAPCITNNRKRPLLVAFWGGTGVGKSSLLNRFVNDVIAPTSIARPTSRQVSLYHHPVVQPSQFMPTRLCDKIKIMKHCNDDYRKIVWIDTPDFNCIQRQSSSEILNWLVQVDVLIYVVSPDRYLDFNTSQILFEKGRLHGWFFVMNKWDKGSEEQLNDFNQQIKKSGLFLEPLIFRTDCRTSVSTTTIDDFEQLKQAILVLNQQHIMDDLNRRNTRYCLETSHTNLQRILNAQRQTLTLETLLDKWAQYWQRYQQLVFMGMEQSIQEVAQHFARQDAQPMKNQCAQEPGAVSLEKKTGQEVCLNVWSPQAKKYLSHVLAQFINDVSIAQLPAQPFNIALNKIASQAPLLVNSLTEEYLLATLLRPGALVLRSILKVVGEGHSALLAITSFHAKSKVHKTLRIGANIALSALNNEITASIEQTLAAQSDYLAEGAQLQALCKEKISDVDMPINDAFAHHQNI